MRHGNSFDCPWSRSTTGIQPREGASADVRTAITRTCLFPDLMDQPIAWLGTGPDDTRTALEAITDSMVGGSDEPMGLPPNPVPAGYTYLGQFIFHDMVFSRTMRKHLGSEETLTLDLNSVYGVAPSFEPHLYETPDDSAGPAARCRFLIGETDRSTSPPDLTDAMAGTARDLPRIDATRGFADMRGIAGRSEPIVADPRNDDHLVLSQLHCRFLQLHNRMADVLLARGLAADSVFPTVRRFITRCFRHAVLHDYLRHMMDPAIYALLVDGNRTALFGAAGSLQTAPVEFTFGTARFGHAMIRSEYLINQLPGGGKADVGLMLQMSSSRAPRRVPIPTHWSVNWSNFLTLSDGTGPQPARRISPFMNETLARRPLAVDDDGTPMSIVFQDLWRCYLLGLPSGQDIAAEIAARLAPAHSAIRVPVLRGEAMLPPAKFAAVYAYSARALTNAIRANPAFMTATPLSYYLLQEAAVLGADGTHLGPVGSYILAHTMAHALGLAGQRFAAEDATVAEAAGIASFADLFGLLDRARVSDTQLFSILSMRPAAGGSGHHRRTGTTGT
jgi:hypothetical protein